MKIRSQHKMRNRISGKGKRGFSSVVGSVFMVLIISVLASAYFVFTLSQNAAYNAAVGQKNQLDLSVRSENLQPGNTTYTCYPYPDTRVNVNANITNTGSTSVQFITFWICASNTTSAGTPWIGYNFTSLTNANIQPGQAYSLNNGQGIKLAISGFISTYNSSYNYASWLVTSRGNKVALQTQIASSNVVVSAQVAQGIGSISMDFKAFRYYDFGPGSVSNGTILPSPKTTFTVPNGNNTILAMQLTNYDNSTQDITLFSNSYVWIISPQAGTLKASAWNIANVTSGRYINSFSTQTLVYGQSTSVYFGPSSPSLSQASIPTVVPVFILLFGRIGTKDFGQNIPFIAFNVPA